MKNGRSITVIMNSKNFSFICVLLISILLCSCNKTNFKEVNNTDLETKYSIDDEQTADINNFELGLSFPIEYQSETKDNTSHEYGFNLTIDSEAKEEAEAECIKAMEMISDIYETADKEENINSVISKSTCEQMAEKLKETEQPIIVSRKYYSMENYEKMKSFLNNCKTGNQGSIIVYEIHSDGGLTRTELNFDGTDMYALDTNAVWNGENKPVITNTSYNRIKTWEYTEKGWAIFEYCVPEPPMVSERINGYVIFRVDSLEKEYADISEKYLQPIGYQTNNLFCSNWDIEHMEDIDYMGLYESLYYLNYGIPLNPTNDKEKKIEESEFEGLITAYLPVTSEQLKKYAVYDETTHTYTWVRLDCGNYSPKFFGLSIPEVTYIKENDDGTISLYVDAVCELLGTDKVISHILTVSFTESGKINFLKNEMADEEFNKIPAYQYRFDR